MDKHVFISHNREDGDFADILKDKIIKAGFKAWIDTEGISPGEDWRLDIDQAIKSAFALIVIMTPEAKASEYVTYEWSFAWGAGIKVIPVVLKQTPLHPRLATLQYLDFTSRPSRPWDRLIEVLKNAEDTYSSSSNPLSQDISPAQILQAASLLATALAQNQSVDNKGLTDSERTSEAAERINQLVAPKTTKQLTGAYVLWVDDRPTNNLYEQRALEALGIQFTITTSTEEALEHLSDEHYDVVISDMGRPPDMRAGYTLLEEVRERQISIPYIIYAGSRDPKHVAEARRRGAIGTTNNPQELFELVVDAIKNG